MKRFHYFRRERACRFAHSAKVLFRRSVDVSFEWRSKARRKDKNELAR